MFVMTSVFAFSLPAFAADINANTFFNGTGNADATANSLGLGNANLTDTVLALIRIVMGFLGLVAVVIILIGGFKWMTAAGNEDKVGEAKKMIVAGIIGLVVILFAFAIVSFVVSQLVNASSTT